MLAINTAGWRFGPSGISVGNTGGKDSDMVIAHSDGLFGARAALTAKNGYGTFLCFRTPSIRTRAAFCVNRTVGIRGDIGPGESSSKPRGVEFKAEVLEPKMQRAPPIL